MSYVETILGQDRPQSTRELGVRAEASGYTASPADWRDELMALPDNKVVRVLLPVGRPVGLYACQPRSPLTFVFLSISILPRPTSPSCYLA